MADLAALAEVRKHPERYRGEQGPRGERGPRGAQGPQGERGEPGLRWRGAWRADTQYERDDVVEYVGSSYVTTARSKGQTPGGGSWELVAQRGESAPWTRGGGVSAAALAAAIAAHAASDLDIHLYGSTDAGTTWLPLLVEPDGTVMVTN